jgi:hypothetical protein
MKATATLGQLCEIVSEKSRDNWDELVPLQDMEFESLSRMQMAGQKFDVLKQAQCLISNRLRIPHSYLCRCPESLQYSNLNHWLSKERSKRDTFFVRFDGNKVRAFFSSRYTAIDNLEVLYKMLKSGFRADQQIEYLLDDSMMIVRAPEYHRTFEVSFKDEVVPGISIGNSEIGRSSLCIEFFALRLVCTNGLTVSTSLGQNRFKHISRKAFDDLPGTICQVAIESREKREQMMISAQTPIVDPVKTIESYNNQFGLSIEEGELVKTSWEQEPGHNLWSVIQAYTASAKNRELSVGDAYKLEKVGGRILSMVRQ